MTDTSTETHKRNVSYRISKIMIIWFGSILIFTLVTVYKDEKNTITIQTHICFQERRGKSFYGFKSEKMISLTISSLPSTPVKLRSKLSFRDSARLLPDSLSRLGESFHVPIRKGIFPYKFVTRDNLTYAGPLPEPIYYNQDNETQSIHLPHSNQHIPMNFFTTILKISLLNPYLIP